MYYVSDGFNLREPDENQFTSLLTLKNVTSSRSQLSTLQATPIMAGIKSQTIPASSFVMSEPRSSKLPGADAFARSLKKRASHFGSSALALNTTERTSANSKPALLNQPSASLTKDLAATTKTAGSMVIPGTSDTQARAASVADYASSAMSQEQLHSPDDDGGESKQKPTGKMLDSDGFEVARMDADDYEHLTLEEKILCGYYTAKPHYREAYPIAQLNIPSSKRLL